MRRVDHLSPTETAVLHAVARYRYINTALLQRVVAASRQTIRDATHKLHVFGLVGSTGPKQHKFNPADPEARREFGKPSLFWVSLKGAKYLNERRQTDPAVPWVLGSDRRPDPDRDDREDAHRLGIVVVHIAFRAWAEATGRAGVSFLCDFEPGVTTKATAIPYRRPNGEQDGYYPDGFARFRLAPDTPEELMVLEFERGGRAHSLSKFFRSKLAGIRYAAAHDLVEECKGLEGAAPFLIVFATEKMRTDALAMWPDKPAPEWGRFFVKALPEIEAEGADFSRDWWRIGGGRCDLYGVRT